MKTSTSTIVSLLLAITPFLASCASTSSKSSCCSSTTTSTKETMKVTSGKSARHVSPGSKTDEVDEYATTEISDPIEGLNRATFKFNDCLYTILLRPISKGYDFVLPKVLRKGINNAFENVKYPVRFVNCTLQCKFKRAGQETEKFVVNTVVGVGGLWQAAEEVPSLAGLPAEDTGLTFANWGMGHGAYLVLPVLGPSSLRDGVGLIGDYALNPVNWGIFWHGKHDWTFIPPSANTLRALPTQLSIYDAATKDAVDPYLSARSAYTQNRTEAARK